jgi:hypothetical protein
MTQYLIRGNQIIATIESTGNIVGMPLFGGGDTVSLMNQVHVQALMSSQGLTAAQAISALGLVDLRSSMLKSVCIGKDPVSLVPGVVAYHLITISSYSIWQVDGQQDDLVLLHSELCDLSPVNTMGLLAVVETFGIDFYNSAVRTATGMTVQEALERRDRIATYLENQGYPNTTDLRSATTEHDQVLGVATALGYTPTQLWNAMVN